MTQIYYNLIIQGMKTLDQVPERIREEVKELLIENGYAELANSMD